MKKNINEKNSTTWGWRKNGNEDNRARPRDLRIVGREHISVPKVPTNKDRARLRVLPDVRRRVNLGIGTLPS